MVMLELGGIIDNDMIINYTIIVNEVDAAIENNVTTNSIIASM